MIPSVFGNALMVNIQTKMVIAIGAIPSARIATGLAQINASDAPKADISSIINATVILALGLHFLLFLQRTFASGVNGDVISVHLPNSAHCALEDSYFIEGGVICIAQETFAKLHPATARFALTPIFFSILSVFQPVHQAPSIHLVLASDANHSAFNAQTQMAAQAVLMALSSIRQTVSIVALWDIMLPPSPVKP
ncbi:unnamed protein product [Sphagnum balticum]